MEVSTIKFFGKSFLLGIIAELRKYKVSDFLGSFCSEFIYPSLIRTLPENGMKYFKTSICITIAKCCPVIITNSGKSWEIVMNRKVQKKLQN